MKDKTPVQIRTWGCPHCRFDNGQLYQLAFSPDAAMLFCNSCGYECDNPDHVAIPAPEKLTTCGECKWLGYSLCESPNAPKRFNWFSGLASQPPDKINTDGHCPHFTDRIPTTYKEQTI